MSIYRQPEPLVAQVDEFVAAAGFSDSLKKALKLLRDRSGLTQEQVAERLSMTEGLKSYSRLERPRGRGHPLSIRQMELCAAALDSNLEELLEIERNFREGGTP